MPPAATQPSGDVVWRPVRRSWLQLFRYSLEWNIATLPIPDLPPEIERLKIVQITDVHLRKRWRRDVEELTRKLAEAKPDLLLVTGDLVDSKRDHRPALPSLYRLLEHFKAPLGCFGILGNHDRYGLIPRLAGTNVRLIENRRELIQVGSATIELIGLPGVDRRDLDPGFVQSVPARSTMPAGTVRIVLSHFPDHIDRTRELEPDLFLAGHTHGGQVCLPGGIPIIKHDSLPRRLVTGVHKVGPTWLVVPRGIGATTLPIRFCCPPEVMEIRLVRG